MSEHQPKDHEMDSLSDESRQIHDTLRSVESEIAASSWPKNEINDWIVEPMIDFHERWIDDLSFPPEYIEGARSSYQEMMYRVKLALRRLTQYDILPINVLPDLSLILGDQPIRLSPLAIDLTEENTQFTESNIDKLIEEGKIKTYAHRRIEETGEVYLEVCTGAEYFEQFRQIPNNPDIVK